MNDRERQRTRKINIDSILDRDKNTKINVIRYSREFREKFKFIKLITYDR